MIRYFFYTLYSLLPALCFAQANETRPSADRENTVTITGTIIWNLHSPMISYLDPVEMNIAPIPFSEHLVNGKNFKVRFPCSKPTHILLFLKEVWVQPGDSVNVVFQMLDEKTYKDTLMFSGNSLAGYLVYPYITPSLVGKSPDYPVNYQNRNKYKTDAQLYRKDLALFFSRIGNQIDSILDRNKAGEALRNILKEEIRYWERLDLIGYARENHLPLQENYKDVFSQNNISFGLYNNALISYHKYLAQKKVKNTSSFEYYKQLFTTASQFTGAERNLLYYYTLKELRKINTEKHAAEVKAINDTILNRTRDGQLSAKIQELAGGGTVNTSDIVLTDYDNHVLSFDEMLKRYAGKVIYLDFWASWCAPCRKEFPYSRKMMLKNPHAAYVFLSIDKDVQAWRNAVENENLPPSDNYLLSEAAFKKLNARFGFTAIPYYVFYNQQGKLLIRDAPRPSNPNWENTLKSIQTRQ